MATGIPVGLESVMAAPRVVKVGGRDLAFRPFRLKDYADLKRWVNEQIPHPVKAAREAADLFGATPEERASLLQAAWNEMKQGAYGLEHPKCIEVLTSPLGVAYTLFLAAKRDTPALTFDDVADLVQSLDRDAIADLVRFVQGADDENPTPPTEATPT